jgi:hypothetical protein
MRGPSEQPKSYKRRLYTALLTSIHTADGFPEMRVQKLWPDIDWLHIWKNLNDAPVSEDMRRICYHVIHDIIPTNVRLHRISMVPSDTCRRCTRCLTHWNTDCLPVDKAGRYGITRKPSLLG